MLSADQLYSFDNKLTKTSCDRRTFFPNDTYKTYIATQFFTEKNMSKIMSSDAVRLKCIFVQIIACPARSGPDKRTPVFSVKFL